MKIVFLDSHTLNPGDLDWGPLQALGQLELYERTAPDEIVARAKEASILIANKASLTADSLRRLPQLRCICVAATGYNNIDIQTAHNQGVVVCNAVGYSSASVAQHVFALLLELSNQVGRHSDDVAAGGWAKSKDWSYHLAPIHELAGQKMGIFGLGKIGQQVAQIALAFGMQVLAAHKYPERDAMPGVKFVTATQLFSESDVISLHVPLTEQTRFLVNAETLAMMKPTARLINTGRGDLIDEAALREALLNGQLAAAGLDVLSQEPAAADHPLIGLANCLLTPHQAWASRASRQRLLDTLVLNIKAFQNGEPVNVVTK